jgi:DNA-directed RNA polymerase subunit RPC12/RpoP
MGVSREIADILGEDFIRCSHCGHPEFIERTVVTVSIKAKPRDMHDPAEASAPLPTIERRIEYICADRHCGKQLNM